MVSTMLVYSIGKGVHSFTLDPSLGGLSFPMKTSRFPTMAPFTCEGNFWQWDESIRNTSAMSTALILLGMVGQWLATSIAFWFKAVFLYPGTVKKEKLRLLYESAPLAF